MLQQLSSSQDFSTIFIIIYTTVIYMCRGKLVAFEVLRRNIFVQQSTQKMEESHSLRSVSQRSASSSAELLRLRGPTIQASSCPMCTEAQKQQVSCTERLWQRGYLAPSPSLLFKGCRMRSTVQISQPQQVQPQKWEMGFKQARHGKRTKPSLLRAFPSGRQSCHLPVLTWCEICPQTKVEHLMVSWPVLQLSAYSDSSGLLVHIHVISPGGHCN